MGRWDHGLQQSSAILTPIPISALFGFLVGTFCSWAAILEQGFFPCPRSRLTIWPRETGSAVKSRVSLLILYTQAEYVAYSRIPPAFRDGVHILLYTPSTAIGPVPSLSGHATAYRWRSLPRVCRHRASSPQGSSSNGCFLFNFHHGTFFYVPLFSHYY